MANPTFGTGVKPRGTVVNVAAGQTVKFNGGSSIVGAVLTDGSINAKGAMHLNFWPFTASP